MKIAIVSAFRNMSGRIDHYLAQVAALQAHVGPDHPVRVIAVEGDSSDATKVDLQYLAQAARIPLTVTEHNHGQKIYGSTEEPARMAALTGVMMAGWGAVTPEDDVVLYVESDLLWHPHQVGSVLDMAYRRDGDFDIVAPLIFAGKNFYDVWGFRGADDARFGPFPPYHSSLAAGLPLTEIHSAGSCLAIRADAVPKVKPVGKEALFSWCTGARKAGLRIAVAQNFHVEHPA